MNFVKHEYLCIKGLREFKGNVKATDDIKSVFIAGQMENLISPVVKFIGNESSKLSFKVRVKIFDANFMNDWSQYLTLITRTKIRSIDFLFFKRTHFSDI